MNFARATLIARPKDRLYNLWSFEQLDIVLRNLQYFPSTLQLTLIPTVFSPGGRARLFTHYNDRTSWNYSSFLTFAASAVLAIRGMELFLDFTLRRFILFVTVEFGANELGG